METQPAVNNKARREQLFIALYKKAFPAVARYVSKMGGSFDEAKDVFQDALIIYYEKELTASITLKAGSKAYLLGISKHLWIRHYHQNKVNLPVDLLGADLYMAEEGAAEPSARLMHYLETAGQKCMELLQSFYYDKLPVSQVAERFGYAGIRSATVQKYKCLEKVRHSIKQKSLTYADFFE